MTEKDANSMGNNTVVSTTEYPAAMFDTNESIEESFHRFEDDGSIIMGGSRDEQRELFKSLAGYIGEISNPECTTMNPFHGKKYAPLDEVLNTARPVLSKFDLAIMQSPTFGDSRVGVRTILTHASGAFIIFPSLSIPVAKNDAQSMIAACTYARRGALNPILSTHGEIDDDGNSASGKKNNGKGTDPNIEALKAKRQEVTKLCAESTSKIPREELFAIIEKHCGVKNPNNIKTVEACDKVMAEIKKRINKD